MNLYSLRTKLLFDGIQLYAYGSSLAQDVKHFVRMITIRLGCNKTIANQQVNTCRRVVVHAGGECNVRCSPAITTGSLLNFWVYVSACRWNNSSDMPITDVGPDILTVCTEPCTVESLYTGLPFTGFRLYRSNFQCTNRKSALQTVFYTPVSRYTGRFLLCIR